MKSVISANLLGRETCGLLCGFLHGLSDVQVGAAGLGQNVQTFRRRIAIESHDDRLAAAKFVKRLENALRDLFTRGDATVH